MTLPMKPPVLPGDTLQSSGPRDTPFPIYTVINVMGIRPVHSRTVLCTPRENSSPSLMPTLFPKEIFCKKWLGTFQMTGWGWCKAGGATSTVPIHSSLSSSHSSSMHTLSWSTPHETVPDDFSISTGPPGSGRKHVSFQQVVGSRILSRKTWT